jgi:hypothetical protein
MYGAVHLKFANYVVSLVLRVGSTTQYFLSFFKIMNI